MQYLFIYLFLKVSVVLYEVEHRFFIPAVMENVSVGIQMSRDSSLTTPIIHYISK